MNEQCQCESAGHCPTLRRDCDPPAGRLMSEVRHHECQNKPHYFRMFLNETRVPCKGEPAKKPETDWDQPTRCRHLGPELETRTCQSCGNRNQKFVVRECAVHGLCSERKRESRVECCLGCPEYEPSPPVTPSPSLPRENPHFSRWAVGITTAPRSLHRTLPECVESVIQNGWEPILFAEPGTDTSDIDAEVIERDERLGVWRNWREAARELLVRFPEAEMILTIQDDTIFHPQAKWFAEHNFPLIPKRFYSLYTPKHYGQRADVYDNRGKCRKKNLSYHSARKWITKTRRRLGWTIKSYHNSVGMHRIHTSSLWGACAMAFPRDVLEAIVNHRIAERWLGARGKKKNSLSQSEWKARQQAEPWRIQNSDTAIGKIANGLGYEYWCPVPSLADHIANHSADGVGHGGRGGLRSAAWFASGDLRQIFGEVGSHSR